MAVLAVVLQDNTLQLRAINHLNSNKRDQILYFREDKRHGDLKRKSNRDLFGNDLHKMVVRWLEAVRLDIKHHKDKNNQRHSMMDQILY